LCLQRAPAAQTWLWRIKKNLRLCVEKRLPDGSYRSRLYPSEWDWRHQTHGVVVRVIDYRLEGIADAEPIYRLVTTILDSAEAPAEELAALYHERWEIEGALDELKTHLRGARIVLRSKTPNLVRQEFYGLRRKILTGSLSCTPCESFVASCLSTVPFPPGERKAFHEAELDEILQERVVFQPWAAASARRET
jgi:hypothetical protein